MKSIVIGAAFPLIILWFLTLRVFVPGLINMHNDGTIILAIVWLGVVAGLTYVYVVKMAIPFLSEK